MKNKILIIVAGTITFCLTSCEKFLETTPIEFVERKDFYDTKEKVDMALAGVYQCLANVYADNFQGVMGLDADEGFYNRSQQLNGIQVNLVTTTEPKVSSTWIALYKGIERANLLLENLDAASMKADDKEVVKGEALFLRAYFHYLLVAHWGDVPLVLEANKSVSDIHKTRTPARDVYNKIIEDMLVAKDLVRPASEMNNAGHVNQSAVKGILARVCLHMAGVIAGETSKFELARDMAKEVKDDSFHRLNPDYKQVFINLIQDKYDLRESIWEVEFYGNINDSYNASGRVGINNGISYFGTNNTEWGYSYGYVAVNPALYYSYSTGDLRRDWVIGRYTLSSDINPTVTYFAAKPSKQDISSHTVGKFRREYELSNDKTQNGNSTNFPLLRYSDILLMYAEAEVQASQSAPTEEAKDAVKAVRARAFGKLYPQKEIIDTLILNQSGTSYSSIPEIRIIGGGGSGAKAIFRSINSGAVSDFVITDRGSGYTSVPTVEVGNLWKSQTLYRVGDTVAHLGNLYAVNTEGISTNTPPTHTSGGQTLGARFLYRGNAVRMTAKLTDFINAPSDVLVEDRSGNYSDFMKLIKEERSRELAFEGFRKRDLVRWGEYVSNMQASYTYLQGINRSWLGRAGQNTTARDVLWPIPSSEITTNILITQNKGW